MELEKMSELEFVVKTAIKTKQSLGLIIEMPGFESPELIINPVENLEKKLEYYKNTYSEDLEHKHAKGIKIIAYTFC
ncbi:hypothetical protein [Desulfosporosinus sp. OT]|uniref:hypothetical protein n=1 Tax=Desulfosporosinus sp. OT TaxID=913865 RepID=UPI000223A5DE|nr:hypothetical protein [Desulfosporosinus sp. OT]EGW39171.1 hypothetical protein DOT_2904 [Desulfosporosinus sp. OT]